MTDHADIAAMILAAGEGTRLRPLTLHCPKPLLPFLGVPILARIHAKLQALELGAIAINTHHLAPQIEAWTRAHAPAMILSHEPSLLGSGGGVRAMRALLPPVEHLLYHNGDILTDAPLDALIRAHRASNAEVTMLLTAATAADGNLRFDATSGRVVTLPLREGAASVPSPDAVPASFAGIMLFRRAVVDRLPADKAAPCIIRDAIAPMLAEGAHIHGVFHHGRFSDLGTPARWLAGLRSLQAPPFPDEHVAGLPEIITLQDDRDHVRFLPLEAP